MGFSPPPPLNAYLLFPFTTFIFRKFFFYHFLYIMYSTFSIVLIVFPVLLFQCLLFRLPHVFSANQFPVLFPDRRSLYFPDSWPFISLLFFFQTSHSQFSSLFLTVSMLSFSNFFTDSYRTFLIRCHLFNSCHVHQLSNSKFSSCFFFSVSPFSVSILPFHCLRIPVPSLNIRHLRYKNLRQVHFLVRYPLHKRI